MGVKTRVLILLIGMLSSFASVAYAAQGKAVFYGPSYTPSACYGNQDNGAMVAGVSDALWGGGAACGRRYRVSCIRGANEAPHPCKQGSVVVKVVDYCRRGCTGDINLSRDAFTKIADPNAGKVIVQYDQVS